MGNVTDCLNPSQASDEDSTPDLETRRRLQDEAARKRQEEHSSRGIKDPERVKRQQEKDRVVAEAPSRKREDGVKWQVG